MKADFLHCRQDPVTMIGKFDNGEEVGELFETWRSFSKTGTFDALLFEESGAGEF